MKTFFKLTTSIATCILISSTAFAQEDVNKPTFEERFESLENKLKKITLTGHFQGQYIHAQQDAVLRIGSPNSNSQESFSRIGIRQGRMRFMFEDQLLSLVFHLDASERGLTAVDAFAQVNDPWMKKNFLRAGLFFRQFGHEVRYPTARRETPERTRIMNTLFPGARDLGVLLHLQADKRSPFHLVQFDLSLVTGNGINSETDNKRDFIGSLGVNPELDQNLSLRIGTSYYLGNVYQGTRVVYRMNDGGFTRDSEAANRGKFAKREYIGFDVVAIHRSPVFGKSELRAEYIFGQQPGSQNSSISPNSSTLPSHDTYLRRFQGGYITIVQDIGKYPFAAFSRYDWYDPNTKISGNDIGTNNTTFADLYYTTLGLGFMWKATKNLDISAYYEFVRNETTTNIADYSTNRKDNMLTFTMMFRY